VFLSEAIVLALGSMVTASVSDLIYRHVQTGEKQVEPLSFLVVKSPFFTANVLMVALLTGGLSFNTATLWLAPVSGALGFAWTYLMLRAMRQAEAGTTAATLRMNFLVTTLLAVLFLGEALTWRRGLGTATAALAVVFLYQEARSRAAGLGAKTVARFSPYALWALGVLGVWNFVFKVAVSLGIHPPTYMFTSSLMYLALLHLAVLTTSRYRVTRRARIFGPITGVLISSSALFLLFSFRAGGAASTVVPIMQMSFVLTTALGALVLREGWSGWKAAGLAAAAGAVWLLAGG